MAVVEGVAMVAVVTEVGEDEATGDFNHFV